MSWPNEVVLEYLELYKREEILWNPKHPNYRNRSEVTDAWLRIKRCLSTNFSVSDLKKKKESLMTAFRLHMNRKNKCQGQYQTSWFAYSLMESFLGEKYECDSTNHAENTQMNEYQLSDGYNIPLKSVITEEGTICNVSTLETTNEKKPTIRYQPRSRHTAAIKNRNLSSDLNDVKKQLTDVVAYMKKTANRKDDNAKDEYDLYGQLLAKKLRKLEERQRDEVMHDIDNIMFQAKSRSTAEVHRQYSSSVTSPGPKFSSVYIGASDNHQQLEDEGVVYEEHAIQNIQTI